MATHRSGRSPRTRNPGPSLVTEIGTSGSAATVAGGAAEAAGRAALAWPTSAPRAYRSSRTPSPVAAETAKNGRPRAPGRRLGLGEPGPALGQVGLVGHHHGRAVGQLRVVGGQLGLEGGQVGLRVAPRLQRVQVEHVDEHGRAGHMAQEPVAEALAGGGPGDQAGHVGQDEVVVAEPGPPRAPARGW